MSNPARIVNTVDYSNKLFGDNPVFLAVAMTLLDNEVSLNTCENHLLSDEIASLTLAGKENIEIADFIFITGIGGRRVKYDQMEYAIRNAKSGTPADPHKSAAIIIRNDDENTGLLLLSGPGIDGHASVSVSQTVRDAINIRDAQNYEYPQGIDFIFISDSGELSAVPRLVKAVR